MTDFVDIRNNFRWTNPAFFSLARLSWTLKSLSAQSTWMDLSEESEAPATSGSGNSGAMAGSNLIGTVPLLRTVVFPLFNKSDWRKCESHTLSFPKSTPNTDDCSARRWMFSASSTCSLRRASFGMRKKPTCWLQAIHFRGTEKEDKISERTYKEKLTIIMNWCDDDECEKASSAI